MSLNLAHKTAHPRACQPREDSGKVRAMSTQPSKQLETFDNPMPERDYTIRIEMVECFAVSQAKLSGGGNV